jgi:tetratricopeptide (TPR) repeat protein
MLYPMSAIRNVLCIASASLIVGFTPGAALAQQRSADAYYEFLMARRLETAGDSAGALAALERAAAADPTSAEIRAEIAAFHFRRTPAQRVEGEKAAKEALALDVNNVEANRALGFLYANTVDTGARNISPQMMQDAKNAVAHLERAVAGSAGVDAQTQYTLGRLYLTTGDSAKAVQALTRVVAQNPNNPQALQSLAQAYAAAGDLKGAIRTLQEVVDYVPRVAVDLAGYQVRAGLLKEAAASYAIALAAQPNSREIKVQRIAALYNAKEYAQAAALAGEARKQHPDDQNFARLQARALFDAGDRSAAIAVAEASAKAFPRDSQTKWVLAELYSEAGRDGDRERLLRQMVTESPSDARALNELGYLLATRGEQLDEAITLVRRALDSEPNNGAYLDSLGWAYFRRGDLAEAHKYLAAAAERMPASSEVLDHLGDVHARRGELTDAIAAWTRALAGDGRGIERPVVEQKIGNAKVKMQNAK